MKKYIVIASRKKEGYLEEVRHNSEKIEIYCRWKVEKECLLTRNLRFKLENLEDNKERLLAIDLWTMPLIRLWGLEKYERIEIEVED
ncbi:hypothetical protein FC40_GL000208 [Ligilactobacillus hayakitensis DSM 18933 = JCM 14209]|uniref:Uncharacterized protein n=1 Tax=Ligilactobacillus hayakitensis DSM 18933 = JCM 14209 TaxID=1423755 RepID=A0A0R1WRQ8_9LACO|nr:hypothetical protein [Ligilactobacillus hayakitensis]KRM20289.1 hypothetical protein FC40_GL000208 [Ligilactobacillus hayakitensis DSM 18933 = JCM 14209]